MAAIVSNDDERERRVLLVGEYFINNPDVSTRKAALYFSENFFKISNATIHDYLNRFKKKVSTDSSVIDKIMEQNKPESIKDEHVQKRVLEHARLFLNNMTVEEISSLTGNSFWTVYRDLHNRLKNLNLGLYNNIQEIMNARGMENLEKRK